MEIIDKNKTSFEMKSSRPNTTAGTHWGELPPRETHRQEVITPDVIENVWRQITDESKHSGGDMLSHNDENQSERLPLFTGNPHVYATINLHQQLRALQDGIPWGKTIDIPSSEPVRRSDNAFHFLSPYPTSQEINEESTIMTNEPSKIVTLRPETARRLLRHAVIVMLAHIGFENSVDTAVETLTDIAEQFLKRTAKLIKLATEREDHGFPDAVERVLLETGVGGVQELHDYYQENILRYEEYIRKKVEKLAEERRQQMDIDTSNIKTENDDSVNRGSGQLDEFGNAYGEVPTLQLLDPDLGFPPSLDAGFQMLHSLEQEGLNGLEVEEEEVNVSDSPETTRVHRQETMVVIDKRKKA